MYKEGSQAKTRHLESKRQAKMVGLFRVVHKLKVKGYISLKIPGKEKASKISCEDIPVRSR